jgi:hypothetical protein
MEDLMLGPARFSRDPFEGKGAYRTRIRVQIQSAIALVIALAACGLTAAMWFGALAPAFEYAF